MTSGTLAATTQGPCADVAANQMPSLSAYQVWASTRITGAAELNTYCSGVPAIGCSCGAPAKLEVKVGPPLRGMVAVCGIEFSITASFACGVPATAVSTTPAGELAGMLANAGGSPVPGT